MTAYVDKLKFYTNTPLGDRKWCHLFADTEEELHEFAARIGMKRAWFQDHRFKHYDLIESKRRVAIKLGAVEEETNEFIRRMKLI